MTAASSFATVFMRFPFASKRGTEDQAIGVPGIESSENMQRITVSTPNVTFSGTERQKPPRIAFGGTASQDINADVPGGFAAGIL